MQPHKLRIIIPMLLGVLTATALARPIDFREISLLVRAHDSDSSIVSIASERKLARQLTPAQEATLRAQGASDSLIRSLRGSNIILSQNDAAAYESIPSSPSSSVMNEPATRSNVQIVDVGTDQPINLGAWGGPDLDLSFRGRDIVETDRGEVQLIEPTGSGFRYTTDHGFNSGNNWVSIDPNYTSVFEHAFTRPLHVDWRNPVRMDDVPYLLYPIYALRGVSLYYIGRMSDDSVRLAVVSK